MALGFYELEHFCFSGKEAALSPLTGCVENIMLKWIEDEKSSHFLHETVTAGSYVVHITGSPVGSVGNLETF